MQVFKPQACTIAKAHLIQWANYKQNKEYQRVANMQPCQLRLLLLTYRCQGSCNSTKLIIELNMSYCILRMQKQITDKGR